MQKQFALHVSGNQGLSVPLTIQEAIYPGAPTSGIARLQEPVTVGIPLPQGSGITSTAQLGLSGARVGQFRVLGRWPSSELRWVLVDTQADVPAGGQQTGIALVSGRGNFGGPNLLTDNGATISVNTGVAQFTIRKKNFDLFDSVLVNGKQLVQANGDGFTILGPAYPNSDCPCSVPYSTANDPNSDAVIEENGPARGAIKGVASFVDSSGHVYMHLTVRMHFYAGKSYAKVTPILRNADETDTATKGFTSFEARLNSNLGSGRSFSIGTAASPANGFLMSGESAYIYQAYSNNMEVSDWNADNCDKTKPLGWDRCVGSPIVRTPNGTGGFTYAQDGFQVVKIAQGVITSGDHTQYPQGWADLTDSSGSGIEIGVYQFSAFWPKSLGFFDGGNQVRVGIWPDQGLYTLGGGSANYQAWAAYSVHDLFFNFHDKQLPSPALSFLAFQHFLVARAPISQYNAAQADFYPLLDPKEEAQFLQANGVVCCMKDKAPKVWRHYDWPGAGAGNQHELRWSYVRNFLESGQAGRYLFALHFYRLIVEHALPRADGFSFRNHPISQLDYRGFPTDSSANFWHTSREFIDGQHAHWYGMSQFYFLTGDETIHDQLLDGAKTSLLNFKTKVANGAMFATRDIGERLMNLARFYQFLSATGDPDAALIQPMVEQIMSKQVWPELNVSGFGSASQGVSRTRGIHYGCCSSDSMPGINGQIIAGRTDDEFQGNILQEGMFEISRTLSTSWSYYTLTDDLMFGNSQWARAAKEGWNCGVPPSASTCGPIYQTFLDVPNSNNPYYVAPYTPSMKYVVPQTSWFTFFAASAYSGDMSWQQQFIWYLKRSSDNYGMNWAEYGSHMMQAAIYTVLHPPKQQLVNVQVSATNLGGGSYLLSFVTPPNATALRVKSFPFKKIVDWIGFDGGANQFIGDPTTTWPWFSTNEVANPPAPIPGPQTFTVNGLDPSKSFNFAIKAWVKQ